MKDTKFEQAAGTQDGGQPKPWDRQPGEPVDCYHWFRLYLSLSIPRKVAQVAKLIGTNSDRTYMSKIARRWRWKERAALVDADKAEQIVIQFEMRNQLLLDQLFNAQFQGLLDTTQAIENAQLDRMDRAEARGHLSPITRYQLGLLGIVMQQGEEAAESSQEAVDAAYLEQMVEEMALAMVEESDRETEERILRYYGSWEAWADTYSASEEDG